MSVPAMRRIVVGVDGSAESAAAFRWACREASLRGAEVHAVHVREANCHGLASYAVAAPPGADDEEVPGIDEMWRSLLAVRLPGVQVRTEVVEGLAARVLLQQCAGADMLILGTASDTPGPIRSAGPVIRACLRRASCPVVVISVAQDPVPRREPPAHPVRLPLPVPEPARAPAAGQQARGDVALGAAVPAGAGV